MRVLPFLCMPDCTLATKSLVLKRQVKQFWQWEYFSFTGLPKDWDKSRFDLFLTINKNSSVITSNNIMYRFLKVLKDDTKGHVFMSFPSSLVIFDRCLLGNSVY